MNMSRDTYKRDSKLHQLLRNGRPYSLDKQQIVQSTEDRQVVNIIISGYFRKYLITNDGSLGAMIIYGPEDIFPVTLMYKKLFDQPLYHGLETHFYEAMSPAEVRTVDVDQLVDAIHQDQALYPDLLQEVGRHLDFCINSIENIALRSSEKRIAHMLCYFARKFGSETREGIQINLPLTHQNIGEILNITRETVSTNIKGLRDRGLLVAKGNSSTIVPDLEKLEKEAYSQS
jgi:CRP-like cAMP-binding protein